MRKEMPVISVNTEGQGGGEAHGVADPPPPKKKKKVQYFGCRRKKVVPSELRYECLFQLTQLAEILSF
jgi:hypothetical protein